MKEVEKSEVLYFSTSESISQESEIMQNSGELRKIMMQLLADGGVARKLQARNKCFHYFQYPCLVSPYSNNSSVRLARNILKVQLSRWELLKIYGQKYFLRFSWRVKCKALSLIS